MSRLIFEDQFPEPLRCWIVHAPKRWPGPQGWWLDLARERIVKPGRGGTGPPDVPTDAPLRLGDVTYLPPVDIAHIWWRRELRDRLAESGACPVVQFLPGEEIDAGGGVPVVDLTGALLPPKLAVLGTVPTGVHCCWPLIPGLTSDESLCRRGLEKLAAAGAAGVHAVVPELSSVSRRKLGDLTDRRGYQELFHGALPEVRLFARWAHEVGLSAFLERPACGRTGRALSNRNVATRLYLLGELISRTSGSMDESLSFYRAGRWADREVVDIEELVRSGNLGLVPEAAGEVKREIELVVRGETSARLKKLELDYLGAGGKVRSQ